MALPNYYFKDQVLCYIARFHLTPWTLCGECEKTLKNYKIFEDIEGQMKKFVKMGRKLMCGQHWISDKYVPCTAFSRQTGVYPDLVQYTMALFIFNTGKMNAFPLSKPLAEKRVTPK
jgi:PhoPQ-activated pathogenicity-related protein